MTPPICTVCKAGKMLVETTRPHENGLVHQYRKCSNKSCGYRKSTWRFSGVSFSTEELAERLLGQSSTTLCNPFQKRVFIVATTGNLETIEVVELTEELTKEQWK